ncbi:hypothetical protein [Pleionea sp. CnH1-48]|uniref:hypothetical protein n=1 Tax=Pleionea sp. CnH1-48 TaxID=2954494 RepID=UPI0020980AF5|nr:hypothetical protein [Pleionea sp. CnH1-48]MCO7227279.1 hypothetical protein [Pleionea sp. CnH1-48]
MSLKYLFNVWVGIVLVSSLLSTAHAVKPVRPPVKVLVNPYNVVVEAKAVSDIENGKVVFEIKETLFGKSEDKVTLRLNEAATEAFKKGQTYLIVYSHIMKHPIVRDEKVQDPDGPRILNYMLLRAAMFDTNKEVKALFDAQIQGAPKKPSQMVALLLKQMKSNNPLNRQIGIFELHMQPKWLPHFTDKQRSEFKEVIAGGTLSNEMQTYALKSFLKMDVDSDKEWLAEQARSIIKQHGSQVKLASFVPGLIIEAADVLGSVGTKEDIKMLNGLLDSNSPSVARTAFQSMAKLDENSAKTLAQIAVNERTLLNDTRRILENYIKK